MLKENKRTLFITSLLILLPILVGLVLWDKLPDQMVTHWNFKGEPDGFMKKGAAVFVLPLFMLVIQWICGIATAADPKKDNHSKRIITLVLWLLPLINLGTNAMVYATALGKEIDVPFWIPLMCSLLFTVIGNYLPKCRQNHTIGIRLPWTLADAEVWNKTHRLGGIVWMICGIAGIFGTFIGQLWIFILSMAVMIFVPGFYSMVIYKKRH